MTSKRTPRNIISAKAVRALREIGQDFHRRGWSLGTSSNYSIVLDRDPLRLLLTASGKDKGRLTPADFVVVDDSGKAIDPKHPKPSAETLLHVVAAQHAGAGSVLHTHSVWSTLLSDRHYKQGGVTIEGFEMLKGLDGVRTHEHSLWLEIVDNTQDIAAMAKAIGKRLRDKRNPLRHGFLIRGHGLYTWGRDANEARRHVEVLEFLLEVVGRNFYHGGRRGAQRNGRKNKQ
jgi:methylthioribulose-1-phosphate dehydratase